MRPWVSKMAFHGPLLVVFTVKLPVVAMGLVPLYYNLDDHTTKGIGVISQVYKPLMHNNGAHDN